MYQRFALQPVILGTHGLDVVAGTLHALVGVGSLGETFLLHDLIFEGGQGGISKELSGDGVHPNPDAYKIMEAELLKTLNLSE